MKNRHCITSAQRFELYRFLDANRDQIKDMRAGDVAQFVNRNLDLGISASVIGYHLKQTGVDYKTNALAGVPKKEWGNKSVPNDEDRLDKLEKAVAYLFAELGLRMSDVGSPTRQNVLPLARRK